MEIADRNLYTATEILFEALEDVFNTEQELANEENPISARARYLRYLKIVKKDATVTERLIACYKPQADFFMTKDTVKKDNTKALEKEYEFHRNYMIDVYTMLEDASIEEVEKYREDEDKAVFRKYSKHLLELFGPDDIYQYIIDTKKPEKLDVAEGDVDGED